MPVFPVSFGEVAGALARAHGIRDDKRSAFEARIKNLQRLGFLPDTNTGRGRRAAYGVEECFLLALAIELLQLGVTPERAINILNPRRAAIVDEWKFSSRSGEWLRGGPKLMYFDPRAFAELQDDPSTRTAAAQQSTVRFGTGRDLGQYFGSHRRAPPRLAVIDLQRVATDFSANLLKTMAAKASEVATEINEWGFT